METARNHLVRMIIMILLTILASQVHCSTQPKEASIPNFSVSPLSSLDHVTHFLEAYVPISFVGTPHSYVDVDHFFPNQGPGEDERAMTDPWVKLLGKPLGKVVEEVNKVTPSASIIVKKTGMAPSVLKSKDSTIVVVLFTDNSDIVTAFSTYAHA